MANSTVHGTLIKYEKDGTETNQITIYPKNTAQDVAVTQAGHVPESVTNMQELIAALGSLAFSGSISGLDTSVFAEGVITTDLTITAEGKIADARALKTLNDKITKNAEDITQLNSNKANKYKLINASILSTNWIGEESPYSNSITIEGVTTNTDICILPSSTWTTDIIEAWGNAGILTGEQATNSITLKAYGEKPIIDIPTSILIGDTVIVEGGE